MLGEKHYIFSRQRITFILLAICRNNSQSVSTTHELHSFLFQFSYC